MNTALGTSLFRIVALIAVLLTLSGADLLRDSRIKNRFVGEWNVVKDFSTTSCEADFMLRVSHSMTVNPDLSAEDNFYDFPLYKYSIGARRLVLKGESIVDESCTTKRQIELTYPSKDSVRYRDKIWFVCKDHPTCSYSYEGKALRVSK